MDRSICMRQNPVFDASAHRQALTFKTYWGDVIAAFCSR